MAGPLIVWTLLVLALAAGAGIFLWWFQRVRKGVPVRPWWLGLLATATFLLFLLVERPEWVVIRGATPILDLAIVLLAGLLAARYVVQRASLHRDDKGRWVCQTGFTVSVVWVILFAIRLLIELVSLPSVSFLGGASVPRVELNPGTAAAVVLVGGLLAAGTGLILGQYAAVYYRYRAVRRPVVIPVGAL